MSVPKIRIAGTGEKTQYMVHAFNDNTIRFVLQYPGALDPDCLCQAARAVIGRVDVLHSSFLVDTINAYWHLCSEYEDSCFFRYIETAADPMPTARSLALLPIEPENRTQLRCCLVQGPDSGALVLTVSHLCVDGSDGKYLLYKLAEAYNLLQTAGDAAALEVKNGSRAAEKVYENVNLKEFFSLLKNPISPIKTVFPYPSEAPGRIRLAAAEIPASVMTAARRRAKEAGATANDLLLAACYHAYAALPGVDAAAPMSVMSMMDLRRHCENGESEGLCNMSGSMPTALPGGICADLSGTIAEIAAQTRAAKEDPLAGLEGMPLVHGASRTLPMGLLLSIAGKVYGSMSIGLTNLGNLSGERLTLGGRAPSAGLCGGPLKKKPAMQVTVISLDGACTLAVAGQYTAEDQALLETLLARMAGEVTRYAAGA